MLDPLSLVQHTTQFTQLLQVVCLLILILGLFLLLSKLEDEVLASLDLFRIWDFLVLYFITKTFWEWLKHHLA